MGFLRSIKNIETLVMKQPIGRPRFNLGSLNLRVNGFVTGAFIILTLALVITAEILDNASLWDGLTLAADATNKQYAERVYLVSERKLGYALCQAGLGDL